MAVPKKREKQSSGYVIDRRARIGHVHPKVANIERALGFYCGVLGFEVTQLGESAGTSLSDPSPRVLTSRPDFLVQIEPDFHLLSRASEWS